MIGPKAYIDSSKLKNNILNIKKSIGNRNLMLVIKANGYGHNAIKIANKLMGQNGRILVRKSGTEPKIRIMAESYDKSLILKCIKLIKSSIK